MYSQWLELDPSHCWVFILLTSLFGVGEVLTTLRVWFTKGTKKKCVNLISGTNKCGSRSTNGARWGKIRSLSILHIYFHESAVLGISTRVRKILGATDEIFEPQKTEGRTSAFIVLCCQYCDESKLVANRCSISLNTSPSTMFCTCCRLFFPSFITGQYFCSWQPALSLGHP